MQRKINTTTIRKQLVAGDRQPSQGEHNPLTADEPLWLQNPSTKLYTEHIVTICRKDKELGAVGYRLLPSNFQGVMSLIERSRFPIAWLPAATSVSFASASSSMFKSSSMTSSVLSSGWTGDAAVSCATAGSSTAAA
jgi:hypothetical protein